MASSQTQEPCAPDHENLEMMKERIQRGQWIRAAILGANDGLLSTTSLMLGVGAAKEDRRSMVLSGLAGALAGACSMAVGEFVSVSTQRDIQKATTSTNCERVMKLDITSVKETKLHETEPKLPTIFSPGRSPMMKVVIEDAKTFPSSSELRDDLQEVLPNPFKAAAASALAFLCGSFVPLLPAILFARYIVRIVVIAMVTSLALVLFGGFGAHLGGSPVRVSAVRVLVGGWIAMGVTYGLLKPFDSEGRND